MFYTFRGLGALPSLPPSTMLKPGNEWVRYLSGADTQVTSCPPDGKYGCLMFGGFAWGVRPALAGSEFPVQYVKPISSPGSTSSGSPTSADKVAQECTQIWSEWAQKNPDQYKCLTARQAQKLVEMCIAWKTGKMSFKDYVHDTVQLRRNACIRYECRRDINSFLKQLPDGGRCVGAADREKILQWCIDAKNGKMTEQRYVQKAHELIVARCKTAPTAPPSGGGGGGGGAPSGGGGGGAPTPGDVLPTSDDGLVHDEGAGGDGATPSLLRQWGPVVGIGLLIALGVTLATQKKRKGLTRRRRAA